MAGRRQQQRLSRHHAAQEKAGVSAVMSPKTAASSPWSDARSFSSSSSPSAAAASTGAARGRLRLRFRVLACFVGFAAFRADARSPSWATSTRPTPPRRRRTTRQGTGPLVVLQQHARLYSLLPSAETAASTRHRRSGCVARGRAVFPSFLHPEGAHVGPAIHISDPIQSRKLASCHDAASPVLGYEPSSSRGLLRLLLSSSAAGAGGRAGEGVGRGEEPESCRSLCRTIASGPGCITGWMPPPRGSTAVSHTTHTWCRTIQEACRQCNEFTARRRISRHRRARCG